MKLFKAKEEVLGKGTAKYNIETATYKSSYYNDSQKNPYNPDELVSRKGLEIYEKMEIDDQVRASFMLKKLMIISRNWDIKPVDESTQAKEQADFVYYCFTDGFKGVFKDYLHGVLSALQYGFSISEKTYKVINTGKYAGKIGIQSLKARPPQSFELDLDDYGNLNNLIQHQPNGDVSLDKEKFLIYSYDPKFGNPYGRSDFRSAYRSWFSKDIDIKFWNIYLERNGMPTTVGKYKQGTSTEQRSLLKNILSKFTAKTVITYPDTFDVSFLEAKNGAIAYETAIKKHNTMISRAFLIPELIGFTDHETGSQSLGKEQFDLFYKILEDIQVNIEDLNNERIIKELIDYNFANVTEYPKFVFSDLDTRDKDKLLRIWLDAVKIGAAIQTKEDEDYLRNEIGLPERKDGDEGIMPKKTPVTDDPFGKKEEEPDNDKDDIDNGKPKELPKDKMPDDKDIAAIEAFAEKNYSRTMTKHEERINLTEIVNDYDSLALIFAKDVGVVIEDIQNTMLMKIKRKGIVKNKNFAGINDISINDADMRRLANAFLKNAKIDYSTGKSTAMTDIKKNINLVEMDTTGALLPKEAIEYLTSKAISVAGTEAEIIKKGIKDILMSGLRNGKTESDMMFEMSKFFDNYTVMQATGTGVMLPIQDITGRINTVIRTNLSDAYNMGRIASYNDPNVSDFIPALQYSAILDDRTTDFCAKYDGRIYEANDPIWDNITPPNHFNANLEGTLISTNKGDIKIEDIKIGDLVLTHKGNYKEVYDTMNKFEDKEYFEIILENGNKINITGEHPVLTNRGWIQVYDLKLSDDIICLEDIKNETF